MFFVSIVSGLFLGRIAYIVFNWTEYSKYIWYWLPYERYGNEIYLFRLLPWRFFNIGDGGLEILIMFVTFLLVGTLWSSYVKKWRWDHMFPTIYFTAETMLGLSFLLSGLVARSYTWLWQGTVLLIFPLISIILINWVNRITDSRLEKRIYIMSNLFLILCSCLLILYIYILSDDANLTEKIFSFILISWTLIGCLFFVKNSRKPKVKIERVSSVRSVSSLK